MLSDTTHFAAYEMQLCARERERDNNNHLLSWRERSIATDCTLTVPYSVVNAGTRSVFWQDSATHSDSVVVDAFVVVILFI